MERDFKEDVKINRFKLDKECEQHPSKYLYWSEKLAEQKAELDKLKDRLDLIKSSAELDYRANPRDGAKVTESTIKAMVDSDPGIVELKKSINECKSDVYTLQAAVSSLEHKKSSLDNLRHLFIAGYFSNPGIPKDAGKEVENEQRKHLNRKDRDES